MRVNRVIHLELEVESHTEANDLAEGAANLLRDFASDDPTVVSVIWGHPTDGSR